MAACRRGRRCRTRRSGVTLLELIAWLVVGSAVLGAAVLLLISAMQAAGQGSQAHRTAVERQLLARTVRADVSAASGMSTVEVACPLPEGAAHLFSVVSDGGDSSYLLRPSDDGRQELVRRFCDDAGQEPAEQVLVRRVVSGQAECLTELCRGIELTVDGADPSTSFVTVAVRRTP